MANASIKMVLGGGTFAVHSATRVAFAVHSVTQVSEFDERSALGGLAVRSSGGV